MAERSMKILWMVLLVVAAYQDFRERQVSVMWMVCGAAAGMIGCCLMAGERYQDMLETGIDAERVSLLMNIVKIQIVRIGKAAGIGIALLILAKLTRGAMGGGDGLFFLMSAFYWDWKAAGPVFGDPCDFFCLGNGAVDEETMEQSWNSFGSMEGDNSVFNLLSGPRHSSGLECTDAVRIGKVTGRRAA